MNDCMHFLRFLVFLNIFFFRVNSSSFLNEAVRCDLSLSLAFCFFGMVFSVVAFFLPLFYMLLMMMDDKIFGIFAS